MDVAVDGGDAMTGVGGAMGGGVCGATSPPAGVAGLRSTRRRVTLPADVVEVLPTLPDPILGKEVDVDEVNAAFREASSSGPLANVIEYSDEEIVSSDIVGSSASCIFDSPLTMAMGNLVKVLGWYDNEWGYSNRLVDLAVIVGRANQS